MKTNRRWLVALAVVFGASMSVRVATQAQTYEEQQRAAATARAKDAAWKPTCQEVGLIRIGKGNPGVLKNFCLNREGNILACYGKAVQVHSPDGKLIKTLPVKIAPSAICVGEDDSIFVAGEGEILKLDAAGKTLASGKSPVASETVNITKEMEEMVKEMAAQNKRPFKEELEQMKTSLEKRRTDITGLAATGSDVFMATPAPSDFSYRVYRFDAELQNPKLVVEKLRGCCSQMDIQAHNGNLWIPHNARHAVESRDREGKEILKFGKAGKVKPGDFGGCCEPKNMRVLANQEILVAESGPPTCIKRFSATGKFIEVVALLETKGDCVRVTVAVSPDGSRYYMLDTTRDAIRVFAAKN